MTRKSVFITGAAMGIGRAVASHYADRGWHVGITDINEKELAAFKEAYGPKIAFSSVMDVTDEKQVTGVLADFTRETDGKIDLFINNAGVAWLGHFEDQPLLQHYKTIDVNAKGVLTCAYQAFPYLKKARGTLVNMCSQAANYGVPFEVAYSASKFFVRGLTEGLNIEWEKYGIYVCAIWPNFVDTPMVRNVMDNPGPIINSVGVNLTVRDVVETISKAVLTNKTSCVHWRVDKFFLKITSALGAMAPPFITRYTMKKMGGY